jgi:hypothetical protein
MYDEKFRITILLRARLKGALDNYSKTGKIQSASKYGINYKNIIIKLGICPGDINEFAIDHVFPLCAFDLSDERHIRAAFSPDNHQWLKRDENLKKGANYSQDELTRYLEKFK